MEIVRQRSNGETLTIKEVSYDVAKEMTVKNHYSHKWNTSFGKHNYGIFKDDRLLGVAVYGNIMNPKSVTKIVESGKVIELNRLWIDDELGHNTETLFLGATFKILKATTDYDVVQSFADGRLGCGTIYKASNFKYYGYSESTFMEHVPSGVVYHKVPFENTKRPKGFLTLNLYNLLGQLEGFKVKTYRYIYPLKKKIKVLLPEQPYPEYSIGQESTDIRVSDGQKCRVYLMFNHMGFKEGMSLMDMSGLEEELEKQKDSASYLLFVDDYDHLNLLSELQEIVLVSKGEHTC